MRSIGDYELLEEISRGGMGVVFRARQRSLGRLVALKLLPAGTLAKPEAVKRFQAEASAAAALQHPNIVAIHEIGVQGDQHFIAMDLVDGPPLSRVISDSRFAIHDVRRAARWMKAIAEAVHYAHERGILHRDLKPSNILLDTNDQPRVTDFGLAKRFNVGQAPRLPSAEGAPPKGRDATVTPALPLSEDFTLSGQLLGSPNYMPPEQAAAHRGKASRRSDVYGLGATLYHLLTGRAPFQASSITEVLHQVANADPIAPRLLQPGVPADLETICLKCLEKEPAKRYATAQEFADELHRCLKDEPIHARPVSRAEKAWRWCRRKPALAGSFAALALALTLGFIGVLTQWQRAERERTRAEIHSQRAEEQAARAEDTAANERRERY
jgi:serine/threonine protein kinase